MKTLLFLLISLTAYSQNEMFRGAMYVKTGTECGIKMFRMGGYDDNILMMVDQQILEFKSCIANEESTNIPKDLICRDKCGTNYYLRLLINPNEGITIFVNNILKKEEYYMISTLDICKK